MPVNRHRIWQLVADSALIALAWWLAFWLRFDHGVPDPYHRLMIDTIAVVVGIKLAVFVAFGFYNRWWRYVSTRDMWGAARGVTAACIAADLVVYFAHPVKGFPLPRSIAVLDWLILLAFVAGSRLIARSLIERPGATSLFARGKEVIVVGAGDAAQLVIKEMLKSPALGYTPIGLIDDDPRKKNLRLHGIRVRGTTDDLAHILRDNPPDEVLIAIPSAAGETRRRVVEIAHEAGVPVKTLPGLYELISRDFDLAGQIRPIQVEDVLGREPVDVDLLSIASYVKGETVAVTGAGGSIGSELCRQIARLEPARLVLVEHSESALFDIERELIGERDFSAVATVLGDCGDSAKMSQVFERYRPSVVFHAAAYKHVALLEANPLESVRNNALTTKALIDVAVEYRAARFVLVSTDKAANPKNVMGQSKAICEWIVEAYGQRRDIATRFVAVRFGNVLGSSGSVVPDLPAPDRARRAGDGHASGDDPLLHDDSGGRLADRAGRLHRRPRAGVRPRHGRAGQDSRPRAEHDPPVRQGAGDRSSDRVHRGEAGREAARGAVERRRDRRPDRSSEDPAGCACAARRRVAGERACGAGAAWSSAARRSTSSPSSPR